MGNCWRRSWSAKWYPPQSSGKIVEQKPEERKCPNESRTDSDSKEELKQQPDPQCHSETIEEEGLEQTVDITPVQTRKPHNVQTCQSHGQISAQDSLISCGSFASAQDESFGIQPKRTVLTSSGYGGSDASSADGSRLTSTHVITPDHFTETQRNWPNLTSRSCDVIIKTSGIRKNRNKSTDLQQKIMQNYRFLLRELDAKRLLPVLIQENYISEDDYEDILSYKTRRQKADRMLQKVLLYSLDKPSILSTFVTAMESADYCYVRDQLWSSHAFNGENSKQGIDDSIDITKAEFVIDNCQHAIVVDLTRPWDVMHFFMEAQLISLDEYEKVFVKNTRRDASAALVELVETRLPGSLVVLMHALKELDCKYLLDKLKRVMSEDEFIPLKSRRRITLTHVSQDSSTQLSEFCPSQYTLSDAIIRLEIEEGNKSRSDLEAKMLECLQQHESCQTLNDIGLRCMQAKFSNASEGSILIKFCPLSKRSFAKILRVCNKRRFIHLLQRIMKTKGIADVLPREGLSIHVKVELAFQKSSLTDEEKSMEQGTKPTLRQRIIEHRQYLLEELEPMNYLDKMEAEGMLNGNEVAEIRKETWRVSRSAEFLNILLEKDNPVLQRSMEMLAEDNVVHLVHILDDTRRSSVSALDLRQSILDNYTSIVDEIDPEQMRVIFLKKNILTKEYFLNLFDRCGNQRSVEAQELILKILELDDDAVETFVDAIEETSGHCLADKLKYTVDEHESEGDEDEPLEVPSRESPLSTIDLGVYKIQAVSHAENVGHPVDEADMLLQPISKQFKASSLPRLPLRRSFALTWDQMDVRNCSPTVVEEFPFKKLEVELHPYGLEQSDSNSDDDLDDLQIEVHTSEQAVDVAEVDTPDVKDSSDLDNVKDKEDSMKSATAVFTSPGLFPNDKITVLLRPDSGEKNLNVDIYLLFPNPRLNTKYYVGSLTIQDTRFLKANMSSSRKVNITSGDAYFSKRVESNFVQVELCSSEMTVQTIDMRHESIRPVVSRGELFKRPRPVTMASTSRTVDSSRLHVSHDDIVPTPPRNASDRDSGYTTYSPIDSAQSEVTPRSSS